jgi:hypothetical protein
VNAFNHASAAVGDVVWAGQSTRHIRAALEEAGLTQERVRALWAGVSPTHYYAKFAKTGASDPWPGVSGQAADPGINGAEFAKKVLLIYAQYDLTFPLEYSLEVVKSFHEHGIGFERRVLPCGHYTTGETPFQYIDGWWLGSFVYRAFKALREDAGCVSMGTAANEPAQVEEELVRR